MKKTTPRYLANILVASLCVSAAACATLKTGDGTDATGGDPDAGGDASVLPTDAILSTASHGSTIDLSADDSVVVAANRDTGTATIFKVDTTGEAPVLNKVAEVAVGAEPVAVAIHPGGNNAFVLTRKDQKLVRIDDLKGTPKVGLSVAVGSEPTGLAITPRGTVAFVSNMVDGTVMGIDTASMTVSETIDLNGVLAKAGYFGDGVQGRPALSHPRSVAVTNNGDKVEADESLWITEFYALQKEALAADGSNADTNKVAVVYRVSLADKTPKVIEIPALANMGFKDLAGKDAGCYPNQLLNMNIQGAYGYITSVCASPKGPIGAYPGPAGAACTTATAAAVCPGAEVATCVLPAGAAADATGTCSTNCKVNTDCGYGGVCDAATFVCKPNGANVKTTVAPAVSVIDLGAQKFVATANLAAEFDAFFNGAAIKDDGTRRVPNNVFDIAFIPGTVQAYAPANGSDAVFKIDFNANYENATIDGVGDAANPFIRLDPAGVDPSKTGRLPTGMAITHRTYPKESKNRFGFVLNERTRNVSVLDLQKQEVAGLTNGQPVVAQSADLPTDPAELNALEGRWMFGTGTGRWSWKGQSWVSCQSCHIDGLTDNVTWFFPRGPRQAPSLDGVFSKKDPSDMRIGNWTAFQDEIADLEMGATRLIAGGIGAIVKDEKLDPASRIDIQGLAQAGLAGSATVAADPTHATFAGNQCTNDDWAKVASYVKTIRSPRKPTNLSADLVTQGRELYKQASCQGCHGGDKWTVSKMFYTPDATLPTPTSTNAKLLKTSWSTTVANASFPAALLPTQTVANQNMRLNPSGDPKKAGDFDQLTCVLRNVGTFKVAEDGVGIAEVRRDMTTPGQGGEAEGSGFNPPSLLSNAIGAPYLHAGQVRSLEGLLSNTFAKHHQAFEPTFLAAADPDRATKVAALVQFLLSIDSDAETIPTPALGPKGGDFCAPPAAP